MPTIAECITQVRASAGLNQDECHASTIVVARALGGLGMDACDSGTLATLKTEMTRVATAGECVVYRVDVPQFGHSFALVQCQGKVVLMQSWVACYRLDDWLRGTKEELKGNAYLPKNGETDAAVFALYLGVLAADLQAGKTDNAYKYAQAMFNPTNSRANVMKMAVGVASGRALELKWSNQQINF